MNQDQLVFVLGKYDSIIDFEIDTKPYNVIEAREETIWGSIMRWVEVPEICKLTLYINEAMYVADRLFHLPIEEELNALKTKNFVVKYTIKFIEPLEDKPLDTIRWRKN